MALTNPGLFAVVAFVLFFLYLVRPVLAARSMNHKLAAVVVRIVTLVWPSP